MKTQANGDHYRLDGIDYSTTISMGDGMYEEPKKTGSKQETREGPRTIMVMPAI